MDLTGSRIRIPGTSNLRDLGGYPTRGGRSIVPGRLYRSEALAYPGASEAHSIWDAANASLYESLGIATVIDLRAEPEAARTPTAWTEATGARIVSLPIAEGGEGTDTNYVRLLLSKQMAKFDADDMAAFYRQTLDRRAGVFAAAITVIAEKAPVLVHCSAGKDRTGLLIALVLDLVGTPTDVIISDYALTGIFRPNRVAAYAELFHDAGVDTDNVRALFETPSTAMELALTHLTERYGSTERYLVDAGGLLPETIEELRDSLVVDEEGVDLGAGR